MTKRFDAITKKCKYIVLICRRLLLNVIIETKLEAVDEAVSIHHESEKKHYLNLLASPSLKTEYFRLCSF